MEICLQSVGSWRAWRQALGWDVIGTEEGQHSCALVSCDCIYATQLPKQGLSPDEMAAGTSGVSAQDAAQFNTGPHFILL